MSGKGFLEQDQYERLLKNCPKNLKALFVVAYHGCPEEQTRGPRPGWDKSGFGQCF